MFDDEKAEWDKFFDFFKEKFNEEVGLMPGVFENDDYEIDLIVGEETGDILGVRVMQSIAYEDDEEDEEGDAEIDEIATDEEDEEEDESDMVEMIQYDFVKMPIAETEIEGKPYFQLQFGSPEEESEEEEKQDKETSTEDKEEKEDNEWFKLVIYSKKNENEEEEITGAVMVNEKNPEEITVFVEHPELEVL
ncbi:hypothetical protein NEF87_001949 [Candidatus Lokiarchaeum ossiferum]|uniref:Uncharacterized protein n=1 Tax=Candidatus Lokiarchaeum ossiferum TaxID=2951803 RepID=A0ABY6HSW9_9ARCH|nr:hypothetical protein NEF87_001949 [Candidatus Lokiarchaeum sp. B-35]